jgi:hypothetical protein
MRVKRLNASRRTPVHARELTVWVMPAHQGVHQGDVGEGGIDRGVQIRHGERPADCDLGERPQQWPGPLDLIHFSAMAIA